MLLPYAARLTSTALLNIARKQVQQPLGSFGARPWKSISPHRHVAFNQLLNDLVHHLAEQSGPSKGGENHDVEHERPHQNARQTVHAAREISWRLNPRASSAAMITSCRRPRLSGESHAHRCCRHTRSKRALRRSREELHTSRELGPGKVRANVKSPRPPDGHGLNNRPHLIVGLDRYKPVSLCVVHFSDAEVPSSNLEMQREVVSLAVLRELIESISNIAPSDAEINFGDMPDPRCLQKTFVRQIDSRQRRRAA